MITAAEVIKKREDYRATLDAQIDKVWPAYLQAREAEMVRVVKFLIEGHTWVQVDYFIPHQPYKEELAKRFIQYLEELGYVTQVITSETVNPNTRSRDNHIIISLPPNNSNTSKKPKPLECPPNEPHTSPV